jgi:hypothetical protein
MVESTKLKQQALMLKAAFEERYSAMKEWHDSTAKQMHDQLLMETQGNLNTKG